MKKSRDELRERLLKNRALSDDELKNVSGGKEAPIEGKKYADSNTHAADKPTFKVSGWNTKEKVTVQKRKSADMSANEVKLFN